MSDDIDPVRPQPHPRFRRALDILGVIGFAIGAYALYDQTVRSPRENARRQVEIELKVEQESKQQQFLSLFQVYEQRFKEGTIEAETNHAADVLRDIQTVAHQNAPADPLREWVFEEQLTQPQYVHVLDDAGLLYRKVLNRKKSNRQIVQVTGWRLNEAGENALQRRDFSKLRSVMQGSIQRAGVLGLTVNQLLYGRYWGVGYVLESSYDNCDIWKYEEPREVERDPDLIGAPPATDDRVFGRIKIKMIAGVAWRGAPIRQGEVVELVSERGSWLSFPCPSTNNIGIRGCPKSGDLVGYVEDNCAEQWEKLSSAHEDNISLARYSMIDSRHRSAW